MSQDGAFWRTRLAHVPTWALELALAGRTSAPGPDAVDLGDLVVDPVGGLVRWRGDDYVLTGRAMEVLYALAVAHRAGRRRAKPLALAHAIWRGWEPAGALENLRFHVSRLRRRFPGLIDGGYGPGRGYGLAVDDAPRRAGRVA